MRDDRNDWLISCWRSALLTLASSEAPIYDKTYSYPIHQKTTSHSGVSPNDDSVGTKGVFIFFILTPVRLKLI